MLLEAYIVSTFGDKPPTPDRLAFEMETAQATFKKMWGNIRTRGLNSFIDVDLGDPSAIDLTLMRLVVAIYMARPAIAENRAWKTALVTDLHLVPKM